MSKINKFSVQFVEEEEIVSDNELELLKAEADKEVEPPRCYIPVWVPVESPSEKIQRAKDELEATGITEYLVEVSNDTSCKDTDSNGKKESDTSEATLTSGLGPTAKTSKSPKPQRERKKSKSKSGEEKSAEEGEMIEKVEGSDDSPMKKSPEKTSKSPMKSVGEEELNTVQN